MRKDHSKHCKACLQDLPISAFGKDKYSPDGFTYWCKQCRNARTREYYRNSGGYAAKNEKFKEARREYYARPENKRRCESDRLKREFGITIEEYEEMHVAQDGLCAICNKPEASSRTKKLAVDHCHETGQVRGLLCQRCNRALGLFNDKTNLLENAATYLNKFRNNQNV